MKKIFVLLITFFLFYQPFLVCVPISTVKSKKIVTSTKRIYLPEFPGATNPSIVKLGDGYLMVFRNIPNRHEHWISNIGVVVLDEMFEPVAEPQLLDTRTYNNKTPSQSEDARLIECNGKYYLIYNDNMNIVCPSYWERRHMYLVEMTCEDGKFQLGMPVKLFYEERYRSSPWQKNWTPFVWNHQLLLSYTINPHEVIVPDLPSGRCEKCFSTEITLPPSLAGIPRGGTPAQLVDGEYLAFFHMGVWKSTPSSDNRDMWHYFMAAYTFSAEPPFKLTKISSDFINAPGFYTYSTYEKRVIYPTGFVVDGSKVFISYGKDDSELWIGTIDLSELKKSLIPLE